MTGKVLLLHFFLPLIQHADGKRTDLCCTVLRFLRCVRGDASEGRISGCFRKYIHAPPPTPHSPQIKGREENKSAGNSCFPV